MSVKKSKLARQKAERIQAAQAQKIRRVKIITAAIVATFVILALILVVVFMINRNNSKESFDQIKEKLKNTKTPTVQINNGGIPVGTNGELKPNEGKPTLAIYSDFICPACATFERNIGVNYINQAIDGKLTVELHPVSMLEKSSNGDEYSSRSAAVVWYIAQNDPSHFLALYEKFFSEDTQPGEASDYVKVTSDDFIKIMKGVGISDDMAKKAVAGEYVDYAKMLTKYLLADPNENTKITKTPCLFVNGVMLPSNDVSTINNAISSVS
jgi:protein-disulfide isomerase